MATTDCLTSLLGLSDGTHACFALPSDPVEIAAITDSATGLYLDEVEGLKLQAAPNVSGGPATDVWQRLSKARKNAVVQVRAALEAGRAKSYGLPLYQQRGTLGGLGNGTLMPVGTRAYLPFWTNVRREGALRITSLQLYTDVAVTAAPLLLDGLPVAFLSTTGPSGITTGLPPEGLVIPLDGNLHTLEVDLLPTVRVRQNNFFAGCFGCSRGTPWFASVQTSLQNITATTPGNGFSITVREECTANPDMLCYAVGSDYATANGPVFRYPDVARYIGIALLYKAAELFTADLLASNQLSRYTMLEPKMLLALVETYQTKTAQYLAWLNSPEGLGQVQHPCFSGAPYRGPGSQWTL